MIPKLNKKIDIWGNVKTGEFDEMDQPIIEDQCIKNNIWASVIPVTGSLLMGRAADTVLSRTTHKIIIRYNPDIPLNPKLNWIMHEGKRYEIDFDINPNKTFVEIFCQKVV